PWRRARPAGGWRAGAGRRYACGRAGAESGARRVAGGTHPGAPGRARLDRGGARPASRAGPAGRGGGGTRGDAAERDRRGAPAGAAAVGAARRWESVGPLLNDLGAEGWELTGVIPTAVEHRLTSAEYRLLFKRPKP